ncbi:MAG TPA: hypothetical protein PKK88_05520 [Bacteroidales bacterium]|nr:hypothetical protein [Bacteroidales bacterium]
MKKLLLISCMFVLMLCGNSAFSQTQVNPSDVSTSVPELANFHSIIAPMWHKAYPAKDINTLKGYVPQIKANMVKMNNAKLAGILREKEAAWKNELAKFNVTAENYYKACEANDEAAILLAAEKFHSAYEAMNRVVKPFVKEMDVFHQTLYVIYHKSYTEKNYTEIANGMDNLIAQADAITKYPQDKLVKRLKDNTPKFYTIAGELHASTVALKEVLNGTDVKKKDAAIEKVHTLYQKLESVFE